MYHAWSEKNSKTSAKGLMEKRNKLLKQDFLEMIKNPLTKQTVTNAGFIQDGVDIKTYTQTYTQTLR